MLLLSSRLTSNYDFAENDFIMWRIAYLYTIFLVLLLSALSQAGVVSWVKKHLSPINPLCYGILECCYHDRSYKPSVAVLAKAFDNHLFGQHLARITILGAIDGHVTNPNPQKPLVLSLHGPAGTGKNHISRLLVESLFARGMDSNFVTVKMSTKDYPHKERLQQYREELVSLVKSKVSSCPHHVFIFDEVENMPAGLLDSIKSFLDHHHEVDGISYRKAIFIFRSNLAAKAINQHVWKSYEKGIARKDITLVDMERIIMNEVSQNPDAGLYKAKIINSHLVSHFVPFLPLEASHVKECIHAEFKVRGYQSSPRNEDKVLDELQFSGPRDSRVFAVKGCRNVAEKVNIILYQLRFSDHKKHTDL